MKTKYPFLDLGPVNAPYMDEMSAAMERVVRSGRYIGGIETEQFEQNLRHLTGAGYAVGVSNGLDALRIILRGYIELGEMAPGDEVIVPANTYIASVLAISDNGLTPVLAEPDLLTSNLDTTRIESLITTRTRAIMPVHLYGRVCFDERLKALARRHSLLIIEDNAQAIGAVSPAPGITGGTVTGNLGHAAAFSFYPTKNIGALGDAGAVTTSDPSLADTVRALANYGSDRRYHNIYQGFNCRMDEMQAAMLRVKLRHLDGESARRQAVAEAYDSALRNHQVRKPMIIGDMRQVWHQYVVRCPRRDALREHLLAHGVQTDIHYATPPHLQPCYAALAHTPLPLTERMADEVLSLPVASVTPDEAREIADIINIFLY